MKFNSPMPVPGSSRYTVESVLRGHPDKVCDQICDAILDEYLIMDPHSRTAVECMGAGDTIILAGEVSSSEQVDVVNIARSVYQDIGYPENVRILNLIGEQSRQLAAAVTHGAAGDQGVMYGFACEAQHNSLPLGLFVVHELAKSIDVFRDRERAYLPDGKVQVTMCEEMVESVVVSVQHSGDTDIDWLKALVVEGAISTVLEVETVERFLFNNKSNFIRGGFDNDTGLSGRKIIVDAYGGLAPHGGGSFSGKDPSKVDRCGAYMARFVAKSIVANGLSSKCLVSVAYAFGESDPVMVNVKLDNGNIEPRAAALVKGRFDFRPDAIAERLGLRHIQYRPTATYGHFSDSSYPWEQIADI